MSKQIKWKKFPLFWWHTVSKKFSRGLTSPDSVFEKITQVEQIPLIRWQVVWRNHTEQWLKNKIALQMHQVPERGNTSYILKSLQLWPKKEKLSIKSRYELVKIVQKQKLVALKTHSLKIFLNSSNSFVPATNVPNHWWNFSRTPANDQIPVLSLCRNWITFPFTGNDIRLQKIRTLSLWSHKACNLFYFAAGRWSYIKFWSECQRDCFFWWRFTLHWRGEHGDSGRFWLCYYVLPWNSYKKQTDQPRTESHFQILWKTTMHSQQRSTYLFCWWAT